MEALNRMDSWSHWQRSWHCWSRRCLGPGKALQVRLRCSDSWEASHLVPLIGVFRAPALNKLPRLLGIFHTSPKIYKDLAFAWWFRVFITTPTKGNVFLTWFYTSGEFAQPFPTHDFSDSSLLPVRWELGARVRWWQLEQLSAVRARWPQRANKQKNKTTNRNKTRITNRTEQNKQKQQNPSKTSCPFKLESWGNNNFLP